MRDFVICVDDLLVRKTAANVKISYECRRLDIDHLDAIHSPHALARMQDRAARTLYITS